MPCGERWPCRHPATSKAQRPALRQQGWCLALGVAPFLGEGSHTRTTTAAQEGAAIGLTTPMPAADMGCLPCSEYPKLWQQLRPKRPD